MINTGCAAVFMGVCSAAYTIFLKYASIATVHVSIHLSAPCAMQLAVTERVWLIM